MSKLRNGASMGIIYSGPRPLSSLRLRGPNDPPRHDCHYVRGTTSVRRGLVMGGKGKRSKRSVTRCDTHSTLHNQTTIPAAKWGAQWDQQRQNAKSSKRNSSKPRLNGTISFN